VNKLNIKNIVRYVTISGCLFSTNYALGATALHKAAENGHAEVVEVLLDAGADVKAEDKWGRTALHEAAEKGDLAGVQNALAAGEDVNAVDNRGKTALHVVAGSCQFSGDIYELLMQFVDPNIRDNDGKTAMDIMVSQIVQPSPSCR
jgi:ankyrin repeat protein